MAITDVDPLEWNIPLARFLNPFRDDLPDVDIDVPHHQQELAMQRIFDAWPGKTARISNYVMYKERSARREAAKRLGAQGRLPRDIDYTKLGIDAEEAQRIEKKLIGKKRCLSKHCGGVIVFDRKLPQSLFRDDNLILLDKNEVEDLEHLKVDILANRGLSQLMEIDPTRMIHEYPKEDDLTADLLHRGDVLGVTQGESPAMRRLFRAIKPTSVEDCVFATALVRPVAVEGRKKASFFHDWTKTSVQESAIVCEDDAIEKIMKLIGVNAYEADMYRRAFAKRNEETVRAEAEREARKKAQIEYFASVREDEKGLFTIYKLTQDNVLEEKLVLRDELSEEQLSGMSRGGAEKEDEDPEDKLLIYPHKFDPYERETIRILEDLIAIGKTGKPVNISEAKPEIREKTVPIEAKTANEAN
jgi:DNA polymerase III alpha subunit